MDFWQALLLGFLQGATELFPVSSLGHAVLVPKVLGWHYDQSDPTFLPYIVLLHIGTATALLIYFRADWLRLAKAFFGSVYRGRVSADADERLALMLLVGTIPTAVIAVFFEHDLKRNFANPRAAAFFLLVNAAIMGAGELLRRRAERRRGVSADAREGAFAEEDDLTWRAALLVGVTQSLALLPGISRSGSTITAGLLAGLRHTSAARFSFLLATPIILSAGLIEVPSLFNAGPRLGVYMLGAVVAGVTAYLSTRFLLRYFRSGRLDPFAAYCAVVGVVGLIATR
jgi:undecaprenyl-diphosphatase